MALAELTNEVTWPFAAARPWFRPFNRPGLDDGFAELSHGSTPLSFAASAFARSIAAWIWALERAALLRLPLVLQVAELRERQLAELRVRPAERRDELEAERPPLVAPGAVAGVVAGVPAFGTAGPSPK